MKPRAGKHNGAGFALLVAVVALNPKLCGCTSFSRGAPRTSVDSTRPQTNAERAMSCEDGYVACVVGRGEGEREGRRAGLSCQQLRRPGIYAVQPTSGDDAPSWTRIPIDARDGERAGGESTKPRRGAIPWLAKPRSLAPHGYLAPVPHLFHPAWARSEWRLAANRAAGPHNRARRGPPPSLLIEAEGARSRGPSARRAGTTSGPERKWRATCAPRRNKLWYARLSVPGRAADPARGQKADGRMVLAGGPRALRHAPCKSVASRRDHGSVAALHRLCCSNRGKKGSPQKAVQ